MPDHRHGQADKRLRRWQALHKQGEKQSEQGWGLSGCKANWGKVSNPPRVLKTNPQTLPRNPQHLETKKGGCAATKATNTEYELTGHLMFTNIYRWHYHKDLCLYSTSVWSWLAMFWMILDYGLTPQLKSHKIRTSSVVCILHLMDVSNLTFNRCWVLVK